MKTKKELLTSGEVAAQLGVSVKTVRKWVNAGRVPYFRATRRTVRFNLPDVMAALAGGKAVPAHA